MSHIPEEELNAAAKQISRNFRIENAENEGDLDLLKPFGPADWEALSRKLIKTMAELEEFENMVLGT